MRLASLVTGMAREAYARMDSRDAGDYELLKKAILARYNLTPENYRKKFRTSHKLRDETFTEWGIRLRKYYERWVSDSLNDANTIAELIIMEQILNNTTPELQIWLREHEPKTVGDLTRLAETYRSARYTSYPKGKRVDYRPSQRPSQNHHVPSRNSDIQQSNRDKQSNAKFITCFKCHVRGHYQSDCPQNSQNRVRREITGFCHSPKRLPSSFDKHIIEGHVNQKPVKMVKDSGSSCTLVHRKYIPEESLTGHMMEVTFGDGSNKNVPCAIVTLSSDKTSITQEVGVIDTLPVDALLGHDTTDILNGTEVHVQDGKT